MKDDFDQYADAWLEKLDAIVAGDNVPSANDDELLHLATRLVTALAPLQEMHRAAEVRSQRLPLNLRADYARVIQKPRHLFSRSFLLVAALLLGVFLIVMMNIAGLTAIWGSAAKIWHASTSLDQVKGLTIAGLSRPHPGLMPLPLLPAVLPGDTHAAAYGVITDQADPDLLITFVADYHIGGQDVWLYEQPSDLPFSSSAAKTVRIGDIEGQLFQDDAGNYALQWSQHGMVCQIISKLSVERLLALAITFQPIKSWDLIL